MDEQAAAGAPPQLADANAGPKPVPGGWEPHRFVPASVGFPAGEPYPGFFFITGAHRSGTSWMTWLMNSHPHVVASMEAFFLGLESSVDKWVNEPLFLQWATSPDPSLGWTKGMCPRDLARAARRCLVESFMRMHWRPGVRMLGDKTPVQYLAQAALLYEIFPDAKVINCVRDGRDTAVSLAFHQLGHGYSAAYGSREEFDRRYAFWVRGEGEPVTLFTEKTLESYCKEWEWCWKKRQDAAAVFGSNLIDVKYERMLEDPVGVARGLFEWLGVDSDEAVVTACVNTAAFEKITGRKRGEGGAKDFVRKGVQGDWVNYFTAQDKDLFRSRPAGKLLLTMGYASDDNW